LCIRFASTLTTNGSKAKKADGKKQAPQPEMCVPLKALKANLYSQVENEQLDG